eukprot:GHVL01003705.1.p1 GENE.GHVL01003705.1~~GHVL01003705.1.p1  ORF type:complete len:286 (+),score=47.42 GHVL01003705.1:655-1512(+)
MSSGSALSSFKGRQVRVDRCDKHTPDAPDESDDKMATAVAADHLTANDENLSNLNLKPMPESVNKKSDQIDESPPMQLPEIPHLSDALGSMSTLSLALFLHQLQSLVNEAPDLARTMLIENPACCLSLLQSITVLGLANHEGILPCSEEEYRQTTSVTPKLYQLIEQAAFTALPSMPLLSATPNPKHQSPPALRGSHQPQGSFPFFQPPQQLLFGPHRGPPPPPPRPLQRVGQQSPLGILKSVTSSQANITSGHRYLKAPPPRGHIASTAFRGAAPPPPPRGPHR